MRACVYTVALMVLTLARPSLAGNDLQLVFDEGRVTLIATDVTVHDILEEWSRVGNTRIVDAEDLVGRPVRLQLVDVPEADALRVLLRDAAGYVAAPRTARIDGASRFDRVVVMATGRREATETFQPAFDPNTAGLSPMPQTPGAFGFDAAPAFTQDELGDEELEELQEILPEPFRLIDRSGPVERPDMGNTTPGTASRPGVLVTSPDDQSPVFIRPPVRPQSPDDSRR